MHVKMKCRLTSDKCDLALEDVVLEDGAGGDGDSGVRHCALCVYVRIGVEK